VEEHVQRCEQIWKFQLRQQREYGISMLECRQRLTVDVRLNGKAAEVDRRNWSGVQKAG
jgi:hypothetical protein